MEGEAEVDQTVEEVESEEESDDEPEELIWSLGVSYKDVVICFFLRSSWKGGSSCGSEKIGEEG